MIILKKPIISEKSMKLTENSLFTFLVGKTVNKLQIAKAVRESFNVDVLSVKTINVKRERKMQRRVRGYYFKPGYKKAIVELKKGQKIAIFETPKKEEAVVTTAEGEPIVLKERKDILRRTKVKVEKAPHQTVQGGVAPTTQRKVIPT
ncbi:MAG: large subunit ribosomal protein L23 [Microgenomates group bacterium Gr01-1014_93]|nr:MAG: large subunit ribosomal protein L23 [Microgenomates group bacterium Gr01-1014_93]